MRVELSPYDPAVTYPGQKQFDCGHALTNAFVRSSLKPQVKKNLSVAYVLTDADQGDRFVGFYTVAQHLIDLSLLSALQLGSLPKKIPCTRLVMLGIDKEYQGQELGSRLMKHALLLTRLVAKQIGGFGLYLDADPRALAFHQKLGFALLQGDQSPEPSPMFIPVKAIA